MSRLAKEQIEEIKKIQIEAQKSIWKNIKIKNNFDEVIVIDDTNKELFGYFDEDEEV